MTDNYRQKTIQAARYREHRSDEQQKLVIIRDRATSAHNEPLKRLT